MSTRHIVRPLLIASLIAACGPDNRDKYISLAENLRQCPAGTTVPGLDVSHYEGSIDWAQVAGAGYKFAYAKASEGLSTTDADFQTNWSGMQSNGVLRGAYHFFRASSGGAAQADFFLSQVGTMGQGGDLPPMLDWEVTDGASSATQVQEAQNFIDEIKARTGLATIIYTSPSFWTSLTGTSQFSTDTLWIANYTGSMSTCPTLPPTWARWSIWQWSDSGTSAGISGGVDVDLFNGTLADLQALAGMSAATFNPPAQASGNEAMTLVNYPDHHSEIFAKSPGGSMMHSASTGTSDSWATPVTLDGDAQCGSAASFWGGAWLYPELFSPLSTGATGHLWLGTTGWLTYRDFGGSGLTHISTAVGLDGRSETFALGPDGAIWTNSWSTTADDWTGWTSLGGSFVTGAGAVTWGNGTVELFTTDGAGVVWHSWSDSTGSAGWATWVQLGGPAIASKPVGVRWSDGRAGHAEVFARGMDGQLYHSDFSYSNDWPDFSVVSAGTQIAGDPSAVMNPVTGPEVFARSPSGSVLHLAWNGSAYPSFSPVGSQVVASDPFGWTRGDGTTEVFAVDDSGVLVRNRASSSGSWGGWGAIASGFDSCNPAVEPASDAGMPVHDAGSPPPVDAGTPQHDAGPPPPVDAGTPAHDAGSPPPPDAGPMEPDAGVHQPTDAGSAGIDAGSSHDAGPNTTDAGMMASETDAGTAEPDAGSVDSDAGMTLSDAGPMVTFTAPTQPGVTAPKKGCGCAAGSGSSAALLWIVGLNAKRRRRMRLRRSMLVGE